jgi:hypothetical protein
MGFFKGKPKDKEEQKPATGRQTRKSIRTIAPSTGKQPAAAPSEPAAPSQPAPQRPATGPTRPAAPQPASQRPPQAPARPSGPAPAVTPARPASKAPIQSSSKPDFAGDLASVRKGGGPSRTGDAALLEFLKGKAGLLDDEQATQVRGKAQQEGLAIDVAAVQLGFITEDQMVNALTQECWVPHLKVDRYEIRKKALDTITRDDAVHYGVFPVDKLGSLLTLAMVNPLDAETIRALESKTSLDIKKVVATRSEINQVIEKYYSGAVQAKEGSIAITQDIEPKSVTQMLAGVSAPSDKLSPAKPSAPMPTPQPAAIQPEIQDIDDLLSADEAVAPSIVEPISLKPEDIEVIPDAIEPAIASPSRSASSEPSLSDFELDDTSALQPAAKGSTSQVAPEFDFEESPVAEAPAPKAPPKPAPLAPEFEVENQPIQETGIVRPKPKPAPPPAAPAPRPAAPAAPRPAMPAAPRQTVAGKPATSRFTSKSTPAKPGLINLVPVMEEEFQHAITHGKSHVFEKWVGLQTRNRIINAVTVENELEPLLVGLYATPRR